MNKTLKLAVGINSRVFFYSFDISCNNEMNPSCRICLEPSSRNNILHGNLCQCRGSISFYHFKCIKTFIETEAGSKLVLYDQNAQKYRICCEICRQPFKIDLVEALELHWQWPSMKIIVKTIIATLILALGLFASFFSLFFIFRFVSSFDQTKSIDNEEIIPFVLLCLLNIFSNILLLISFFKIVIPFCKDFAISSTKLTIDFVMIENKV